MEPKNSSQVLWMVVRQDTACNKFLVREDLTQSQAAELVRKFEAGNHKQDYYYYYYTPKTRSQVIEQFKIRI